MAKLLLKRARRVSDGQCRFCKERGTTSVFTEGGVWRLCANCFRKRWLQLDLLETEYFEG